MADIRIRDAAESDIAAITAIYDHSVQTGTASFELAPPDTAEMARRMAVLRDAGYPYFVSVDATGRVVGYAYAGPYRTRPGYRHTVEDSLYIAPDMARRGIGRALLRRLIAETEALDFRQMIAVIGDSGHAASIALHEGEGFTIVGKLPTVGHKFGRWIDSVLMQRPLGRGAEAPPTR